MAGTEMDMIGVSKFIDHFITMIFNTEHHAANLRGRSSR
jgi:hypothetical protein